MLGDGRIQLQRRLEELGSLELDLLFMDAFASDSIPVHLPTAESIDLYFKHLKPDGILIVHITNEFVELRPVLLQHATDRGLTPILIDSQPADQSVKTRWVLLTHNQRVHESSFVAEAQRRWPAALEPLRWTDNFASIASLLDWSAGVDWEKIKNSQSEQRRSNPKTSE